MESADGNTDGTVIKKATFDAADSGDDEISEKSMEDAEFKSNMRDTELYQLARLALQSLLWQQCNKYWVGHDYSEKQTAQCWQQKQVL